MHNTIAYYCICTMYFWSSKLLPAAAIRFLVVGHAQYTPQLPPKLPSNLQLSRLDNGGLLVELHLATVIAGSLDGLDHGERLVVGNLAEDDVLAIEPAGDDGGDEELGAVAMGTEISRDG
jgi:hypothetical protein